MGICANFSKLIIDPAKPLVSKELVRTLYRELDAEGNPVPVSFNYRGYRLFERLETFYLEYHKILLEAVEYLEPQIILNVHTHDPSMGMQ